MTKHKKSSWKKGKEFVKKVFINCKYCNKIVKCYPSSIKQFCNKKCHDNYRIGKERPEHSKNLKEAHKRKQFGYKKGEQIGNKNPMRKIENRKKQKQNVKRGKDNHFSHDIYNKEKNWNWQGGISFIPYTLDWTETLRRAIRERDRYICCVCNKYGNTIHHIDYNKKNCNPDNLITLCKKCHSKTGKKKDRNNWKKYFSKLMELKNGTK